jgi:low affinity Fe/Cu permease
MRTKKNNSGLSSMFEKFAARVTRITGRPTAFLLALAVIILWIVSGPIFEFSDTWQLVINTGTTIVTFLMVFLIQQMQNKDSLAIQIKLNEIVAAMDGASNRLINVEDLTEDELIVLHKYYERLSIMSKKDETLGTSHSIDVASEKHKYKMERRKGKMNRKHHSQKRNQNVNKFPERKNVIPG